MAIPDFQTVMLPLLALSKDEQEHSNSEALDVLAGVFDLTEAERKELLPSGQQAIFDNRVAWARTHMKMAGLFESTRRGYFRITKRGLAVLAGNPQRVDMRFLQSFPEYRTARLRHRGSKPTPHVEVPEGQEKTPKEQLEDAYQVLREDLTEEILGLLKNSPPSFFEKVVVEVLVKMGYGGTRKDAGEAIGRSGDEGIDGIIKEDRLGLDIIYLQAKRWDGPIGRPEIQRFAGALQGQRARKGIFITTSSFTKDARAYAGSIESKIVLIDGEQLAELMVDHGVGVTPVANYEVKKVDSDYFAEN